MEIIVLSFWNVLNDTHALFRKHYFQKDEKKCRGVALFVPKILAPKERPDLMMFDENVFESVWVECKSFSKKFEKMLFNLTYNPSKHLEKFLDELSYNLDYAFGQYKTYMYWVTLTSIV